MSQYGAECISALLGGDLQKSFSSLPLLPGMFFFNLSEIGCGEEAAVQQPSRAPAELGTTLVGSASVYANHLGR